MPEKNSCSHTFIICSPYSRTSDCSLSSNKSRLLNQLSPVFCLNLKIQYCPVSHILLNSNSSETGTLYSSRLSHYYHVFHQQPLYVHIYIPRSVPHDLLLILLLSLKYLFPLFQVHIPSDSFPNGSKTKLNLP